MASKTEISGQQQVALILDHEDYCGTTPDGTHSFQKKLEELLDRAGFAGEFQVKVFSYRLKQTCLSVGITLGHPEGKGLTVCYLHNQDSIAEHVWILCCEEKQIISTRTLLQEELERQKKSLPPLRKAKAEKVQEVLGPPKAEVKPAKKAVTSSWPHSLALGASKKPVEIPVENQEPEEELLPEPLPLVASGIITEDAPEEKEVLPQLPEEDQVEEAQEPPEETEAATDPEPSEEDQVAPDEEPEPSPEPEVTSPKHIMDDHEGVAHILFFLWAESAHHGKVPKQSLTRVFNEYYGNTVVHKASPAHQAFVRKGLLRRTIGDEYIVTAQGRTFIEEYQHALQSSGRVQAMLEVFTERSAQESALDEELKVTDQRISDLDQQLGTLQVERRKLEMKRNAAQQARLGIERLRKFIG